MVTPEPSRLTGLSPVIGPSSRVLILGSFPGALSLATGRYYGNQHNHFWNLLSHILDSEPPAADQLDERAKWLVEHGVASWDVVASCVRQGSLDQNIREPEFNNLAEFLAKWPQIQRIVLNGGTAFKLFRQKILPTLSNEWKLAHGEINEERNLIFKVPSTSPVPSSRYRRMTDKLPEWTHALNLSKRPHG